MLFWIWNNNNNNNISSNFDLAIKHAIWKRKSSFIKHKLDTVDDPHVTTLVDGEPQNWFQDYFLLFQT